MWAFKKLAREARHTQCKSALSLCYIACAAVNEELPIDLIWKYRHLDDQKNKIYYDNSKKNLWRDIS
jgi:acetylglutamate synthase